MFSVKDSGRRNEDGLQFNKSHKTKVDFTNVSFRVCFRQSTLQRWLFYWFRMRCTLKTENIHLAIVSLDVLVLHKKP